MRFGFGVRCRRGRIRIRKERVRIRSWWIGLSTWPWGGADGDVNYGQRSVTPSRGIEFVGKQRREFLKIGDIAVSIDLRRFVDNSAYGLAGS